MAEERLPALPPRALARARRLVAAAALASLGVALVAGGLTHASGRPALAIGIVAGYLTGAAVAGSWVVGALLGFGAPIQLFRRFTLGLWPLRVAVLLLGIAIGNGALGGDMNALLGALLVTWVGGQVLHGWVAVTLADAAKAARAEAPTPEPES